jgi:hypothetical protein
MAVGEQRLRQSLQNRLAELVGADETALLMNYLPPVGWADVATKRDLDVLRSEMAVLRSDLRTEMAEMRADLSVEIADVRGAVKTQTTRVLLWLVPTVIAGMGVAARLG